MSRPDPDRRRLARLAAGAALLALPLPRAAWSQVAAEAGDLAGNAGTGLTIPGGGRAEELLFRAMSLIGTRYRAGGSSPETGFDCSGFVSYLFREVMGLKLPRSADEIWRNGVGAEVAQASLEAGDLVFYNTMRRPFSHVGVYVADGRFVHAPASGGVVRTENMGDRYWARRWNGARRIEA